MVQNIRDSSAFKLVMYFKFFMVVAVWGLFPLLVPSGWLPFLGLGLLVDSIVWVRIWGMVVLLDFFVYYYIFRFPHRKLSKYFLMFGVVDNGGLGLMLLALTYILQLPWGIWINIPFQLFFGYWFIRFLQAGGFRK